MKIYILADMEGISGIRKMEEVKLEFPSEYQYGRELMMLDINNAVDACFQSGATEVVVNDIHGVGGGQVQTGKMDERALYELPGNGLMMPSLNSDFNGLILLGHHAKAGTMNGFLDHTMCSSSWFEYKINGKPVGEIGIEAAWAGHFNVPLIAVCGDEAACAETKELPGNIECAVVKWGIGRNKAKCLPLPKAHAVIRQTIRNALKNIKSSKPFKPSLPATVQLTYYRSDMAEVFAGRPDIQRIDSRTVSKTVNSLLEICIK